jgi:hypothetical protein
VAAEPKTVKKDSLFPGLSFGVPHQRQRGLSKGKPKAMDKS